MANNSQIMTQISRLMVLETRSWPNDYNPKQMQIAAENLHFIKGEGEIAFTVGHRAGILDFIVLLEAFLSNQLEPIEYDLKPPVKAFYKIDDKNVTLHIKHPDYKAIRWNKYDARRNLAKIKAAVQGLTYYPQIRKS
jgi:hypothetical protein